MWITKDKFHQARKINPDYYHLSRWDYYKIAIDMAMLEPKFVLEIGAHDLSLFNGSDTLDVDPNMNPTYLRDMGDLPWPIVDKHYNVVMALQCLEHAGTIKSEKRKYYPYGVYGEIQKEIFHEMQRISNQIVISLPWKWKHNIRHAGINEETISNWFPKPDITKIVGIIGKHARIVMSWNPKPRFTSISSTKTGT